MKKRDAYGELEWLHSQGVPERFYAQVKLHTDDEDHPYGQWSGFIEVMPHLTAFMTFVSDEAPVGSLRRGVTLGLFRGKNLVGRLLLTGVQSGLDTDGVPSDCTQAFLEVSGETGL